MFVETSAMGRRSDTIPMCPEMMSKSCLIPGSTSDEGFTSAATANHRCCHHIEDIQCKNTLAH